MGRYCDYCRGDDPPFVHCSGTADSSSNACRAVIHHDCIRRRSPTSSSTSRGRGRGGTGTDTERCDLVDEWMCGDCEHQVSSASTIMSPVDEKWDSDKVLATCKEWTRRILQNRQRFLNSIESSLVPFCDSLPSRNNIHRKPQTQTHQQQHQLTDTPDFISNASLRDYQLHGVSTLLGWYQRGVGGILADEMGLGKTIQTIAFLGCLKADLGLSGPHLVIVPLPVLQNWANELSRFAPSLSFRKISGTKAERAFCLGDDRTQRAGFDVYLTTYETVQCEEGFFADCWSWATVTIDEGHRIKNEKSSLRRALNRIVSPFRLLLTGTPLQNNLHELWALLNYILPEVFKASRTFDEAARVREDVVDVDVCAAARSLLDRAMMLRRLKRDVETSLLPKVICKLFVDMTPLQLRLYKGILQRSDALHVSSMLSMSQLLATLSQLHKVVNHPKQILNFRDKARAEEAKRIANNTYAGAVPVMHR